MAARTCALLTVLVLLAGCTDEPSARAPRESAADPAPAPSSSAGPSTTSGPAARSALDCNAVGDEVPPSDYTVVLDRVALPGARTIGVLEAERQSDGRWFAKAGLGIRAGTSWRLVTSREARRHLLIGWGSPGVPRRAVTPPRCDLASTSGWLWFPGGFYATAKGCYDVDVIADGRRTSVAVAVGERCARPEQRDR